MSSKKGFEETTLRRWVLLISAAPAGVIRMTVIGSNTDGLRPAAGSAKGEVHHASLRMHGLFHSLTYSLELACRGYLCAPLVDCDPVTDPECSEAGKKLLLPNPVVERGRSSAAEEMPLPDA